MYFPLAVKKKRAAQRRGADQGEAPAGCGFAEDSVPRGFPPHGSWSKGKTRGRLWLGGPGGAPGASWLRLVASLWGSDAVGLFLCFAFSSAARPSSSLVLMPFGGSRLQNNVLRHRDSLYQSPARKLQVPGGCCGLDHAGGTLGAPPSPHAGPHHGLGVGGGFPLWSPVSLVMSQGCWHQC